jgi:integrase
VGTLRDILVLHKQIQAHDIRFVFGTSAQTPFQPSNLWRRAQHAWKRANLEPIGLHEARHTFASILIAAGVNAKAITTYIVTRRSRRRMTSTASSCPVRSPRPRLTDRRNSMSREVDLFDFEDAGIGRIQVRL